ncbi:MAG: UbiA family prenyltransferase [Chitinophagaceae bacterium]
MIISTLLYKSTIQLLRFHFSFFLVPVFLFAVSQLPGVSWMNAFYVFIIMHLLVYPASNGYNSYMDRDTTSIGGLSKPLQPTKQLFYVTVAMDLLAVFLGMFISYIFAIGTLFYILASRAYSYRGIRIKKFAVPGFLTVFIFQGGVIFFFTYHACHPEQTLFVPLLPCIISSMLIGASYPLTQIYQHQEDKKDGVITLSYLLGKKGTFVFSMLLFLIAILLMYMLYRKQGEMKSYFYFLLVTSPIVIFFLYWVRKVWRDEKHADFVHSLRMNAISAMCLTIFFILEIIRNHFE